MLCVKQCVKLRYFIIVVFDSDGFGPVLVVAWVMVFIVVGGFFFVGSRLIWLVGGCICFDFKQKPLMRLKCGFETLTV